MIITQIALGVQITMQIVAVVIIADYYRRNHINLLCKKNIHFLLFSIGFLLMAGRRVTALLLQLNVVDISSYFNGLDRIALPFVISCCILSGTWFMVLNWKIPPLSQR